MTRRRPCITLAQFFATCVLLFATVRGVRSADAPPSPDRIVVMISLDGLANFYLDDPRAEMPTLHALAEGGTRASMKASTPTVTWPNHTTLVTGVHPARHGVLGNNYFDRETGKPVTLLSDPVYDKDQIVKTPTIYDLANAQGLRTAAIRWPAIRNAKTLDWAVPDVATDDVLHKYTTPSLMSECQAAGIWADGVAEANSRSQTRIIADDMCLRVFLHVLHEHRPNLALLHLIDIDHIQHLEGPRSPEAYQNIKTADEQVRAVWEALKRDFPDRATLIVVSDHGFSPVEHMVLLNIILQQAGLVQIEGTKVSGGAVHVVVQGGMAMVYVLDKENRTAVIEKVRSALGTFDGVSKIVGPDHFKDYGVADPQIDPRAPDLMLFAKEGYTFGESASGTATIQEKPARKGNHGHDANLPDLHATFIAWGVGIKPGVRLDEVQNTDVAPTIAKLLHLPLADVDGKVITAALSESP